MDTGTEVLFKLVELQGKMLQDALTRAAAVPPSPPANPVGQLKELVEVIRLLTPEPAATIGAEGGPPWLPLVSRAIDALERINHPARVALPAHAAAAPGEPAASPQPEAIRVAVPRWLAPIVPYIRTLCSWADTGVRPELRAQIVAEELSETDRATLAGILQGDGFPSNVISQIPDFQARESWFVPFLYSLRAAIAPQLPLDLEHAGAAVGEDTRVVELEPAAEAKPATRARNGRGK